jgi:thiol-disulfide isomerase/thioredoxin
LLAHPAAQSTTVTADTAASELVSLFFMVSSVFAGRAGLQSRYRPERARRARHGIRGPVNRAFVVVVSAALGSAARASVVVISAAFGAAACRSETDRSIPMARESSGTSAEVTSPSGGPRGAPPSTLASQNDTRGVAFAKAPPGGVVAIVREAAAAAVASRRTLLVYVGATWCEPCRRFHRAAEAGELDGALPRLMLLEFDLDRDQDRLIAAGYDSKYIPLFALASADGTASSHRIEGAIKGEGAVDFILPRLRDLVTRWGRDPGGR